MNFVVRWSRRALDVLAEMWLANPVQRLEINQATAEVDRLLRISPTEQGESREGDRRVLFIPP